MSTNSKNGRSRDAKAKVRAKAAELLREQRVRDRRRRILIWGSSAGVVIILGAVITAAIMSNATPGTAGAAAVPSAVPTSANGAESAPPWAAPSDPAARAKAAGVGMLSTEGTVEHIHSHLSVTVDGKAQTVPALLGIDEQDGQISPLHTHDTSGIVHIESPVKATFTLGQVFTEWDVALSSDRIGKYSSGSGDTVTTFVDGKVAPGNPAAITLADHEDIDIVVTKAGTKATPPSAFTWPAGY